MKPLHLQEEDKVKQSSVRYEDMVDKVDKLNMVNMVDKVDMEFMVDMKLWMWEPWDNK